MRFIRSGFRTAETPEQQRRRTICKACEYLDPESERCTKCGCFVSLKAWLATESCPIGKW